MACLIRRSLPTFRDLLKLEPRLINDRLSVSHLIQPWHQFRVLGRSLSLSLHTRFVLQHYSSISTSNLSRSPTSIESGVFDHSRTGHRVPRFFLSADFLPHQNPTPTTVVPQFSARTFYVEISTYQAPQQNSSVLQTFTSHFSAHTISLIGPYQTISAPRMPLLDPAIFKVLSHSHRNYPLTYTTSLTIHHHQSTR